MGLGPRDDARWRAPLPWVMGAVVKIAIICIVVAALVVVCFYNSFISKLNAVKFAFAGIDVQLKKRFDLIPNLVETVKAHMQHERETLAQITALRQKALAHGTPSSEQLRISDQLAPAIHGLVAQLENYPQLRASENFQLLQRNLSETEEQLSAARRAYNAAVMECNTALQTFPGNLFAKFFGFAPTDFFCAAETERAAPRVEDASK